MENEFKKMETNCMNCNWFFEGPPDSISVGSCELLSEIITHHEIIQGCHHWEELDVFDHPIKRKIILKTKKF